MVLKQLDFVGIFEKFWIFQTGKADEKDSNF